MTLFRLDSSIRQEGSVSRQVADTLEQAYVQNHPTGTVVRRDLTAAPLAADLWPLAASALFVPVEERTPAQRQVTALVTQLADELLSGDAVVIASPLYNYGISQHLKTWIDLVITDPRFAPPARPLAGRPVTIVVARGGGYGPGTPREGWDHATPYVVRVFQDMFGGDVTVVTAELTLADVNPAMAELKGIAAESLANAHELAAATGRAHAELVGASA